MNRRNLLVACILLGTFLKLNKSKYYERALNFCMYDSGEGPCILTFFVTKFWQLFVLRLLTGISLGGRWLMIIQNLLLVCIPSHEQYVERYTRNTNMQSLVAGAFPLVFSLLSDIYGPKQRAIVSSVVQISTGVGLAAGQGVSGLIGPALGWRWPFVLVAAPAIVVAVLMIFVTKEPVRGYNELQYIGNGTSRRQQYSEHISWSKLKILLRTPTNVLCILQGLPGCLPWGILLTFLNDFLAQEKGISVAKATSVVLMVGIGGACGVIVGGLLGQYIYNRAKWGMSVFIGTTTVFASLPLWFLVNTDVRHSVQTAYLAAFSAGALSSTVGPNIRAMIMNVNEPETRGVALALQSTLDDLGKGLGPALVAALISRLGRLQAFNIAAVGWIPCGLLLLFTALTLSRDECQMRQRILAPNLGMEAREMELVSERDLE